MRTERNKVVICGDRLKSHQDVGAEKGIRRSLSAIISHTLMQLFVSRAIAYQRGLFFLTQTGAHKINLSSVNDVESEHLPLMNTLNLGTAV
jgi:hypothetical protein